MVDRNPVDGVLNCVERLIGKLDAFSRQYASSLDNLLSHVETLERELITGK
jgi:hypothetical protein